MTCSFECRRSPEGNARRAALLVLAVAAVMGLTLGVSPSVAAPVADELEHGVPGIRPAAPLYSPQGAAVPGAPAGQPANGMMQPSGQPVAPATASSGNGSQGNARAGGQPAVPELTPYVNLQDEHEAWRQPVAAPGQVAPGVRLIRMRDNMVGVIHTRAYKRTLIRLPACEEVTIATPGDTSGFVATVPALANGGASQARSLGIPLNEVEVSTKISGSDTSLHIRTRSGRLYAFQVFAEPLDYGSVSDLTVLVEHDGACAPVDGATQGGKSSSPADFVRTIPFNAQRLRFDAYKAYGASATVAWLAPDQIAYDGVWLFLNYGRRADLISKPVAMNVVEGVPSPAQQEWVGQDNEMLVVKSPAALVMLQSGNTWLCVRRTVDDVTPVNAGSFVIDPSLGRQ